MKVIDRDTESGRLALRSTDDITVLLERSLLEPHPDEDVVRVAARIFLTEPLYASAGNYYQMYNWVTAAMSGRAADELHTLLYELWCGGWQVRLDDEGVVLAQRKV